MNKQLESFARDTLKTGLNKLPESNQDIFKKMYGQRPFGKPYPKELPINEIVDKMDTDKLNTAMDQVQLTLDRASKKNTPAQGERTAKMSVYEAITEALKNEMILGFMVDEYDGSKLHLILQPQGNRDSEKKSHALIEPLSDAHIEHGVRLVIMEQEKLEPAQAPPEASN